MSDDVLERIAAALERIAAALEASPSEPLARARTNGQTVYARDRIGAYESRLSIRAWNVVARAILVHENRRGSPALHSLAWDDFLWWMHYTAEGRRNPRGVMIHMAGPVVAQEWRAALGSDGDIGRFRYADLEEVMAP
jgi:hypothetical protein